MMKFDSYFIQNPNECNFSIFDNCFIYSGNVVINFDSGNFSIGDIVDCVEIDLDNAIVKIYDKEGNIQAEEEFIVKFPFN